MSNSISLEKLALSSTFFVADGKAEMVTGANNLDANDLPVDFLVDAKYRITGLLGKGGMGSVYRAHHQLLNKQMALKTISRCSPSSETWQRFQREVQAIARLKHKNIVQVFDFGFADGHLPYYTMELLEGESLAQRLERLGPCQTEMALKIFIQVADALAHAHRQQIFHRDIKPANIYLENSNSKTASAEPLVKIVDFGIAKLATDNGEGDQYLTRAGTVFGSPLYMSPEQTIGNNIDHRSDIYSFGCALFHTLAGAPPFVGENIFDTFVSHQSEPAPVLRAKNPHCKSAQRLDSLMARLLAKNAEQRPQSFESVKEELEFCLSTVRSRTLTARASDDQVTDKGGDRPGVSSFKWAALGNPKILIAILTLVFILAFSTWALLYSKERESKKALPEKVAVVGAARISSVRPASAPDLAPPARGAEETGYFPVRLQHGPNGDYKTIVFPVGDNRCDMSCRPRLDGVKCSGEFTFPAQARLFIHCREGCTPAFLRRLPPQNIDNLKFEESGEDWNQAYMEAIAHLSELTKLDVTGAVIDGRAIDCLNKFAKLSELKAGATGLTGLDLSKLTRLNKLNLLSASRTSLCPALLKSISPTCKITVAFFSFDDLVDQDLATISKMANITTLYAEGNNFTKKGIDNLSSMPNLHCLSITKSSPDMIMSFQKIPRLNRLKLNLSTWSDHDMQVLRHSLPRVAITSYDQ